MTTLSNSLRGLSLALVFWSMGAVAAAEPEAPLVDCAASQWILDGAATRSDQGSAAFNPEWTSTLEGVAACFRSDSLSDACVGIRGHSDDTQFDPKVAGAFGSVEAAHLARARGRALEVLSRLYQLGVPAERLREVPPALGTGIRGVELAVIPQCIARAPAIGQAEAPPVNEASIKALVRESVQESQAEAEARRHADEVARRPVFHFFVDGGLTASMVGFAPSTFGPTLQPAVGVRLERVFARAELGAAMGNSDAQRLAYEFGGALGYFHAPALQLGVVASNRYAGPGFSAPWLEQTWSLGVEGTHCLFSFEKTEFCLTESVRPLGRRTTRGQVVDGRVFQIQPTTEAAYRFDLGLKARWGL